MARGLPGWANNTRRRFASPIIAIRGAGPSPVPFIRELSRYGLLARIWVSVRGNIANLNGSTVGAGSRGALGKCAIISKIRVYGNNSVDIYQTSGEGYHYLVRPMLDLSGDPQVQSDARSVIATGALNLDFMIPLEVNLRDEFGLWLLQSDQALLTLQLDWSSDQDIFGTGFVAAMTFAAATVTNPGTPTAYIYPEFFTLPPDEKDQPNTKIVHSIIEEQQVISAAGQLEYKWPRGGRYMSLVMGITNKSNAGFLPAASTPTDGYVAGATNTINVRVSQTDSFQISDEKLFDMLVPVLRPGTQRLVGTYPLDLMGSSGFGNYGEDRDTIYTPDLTDISNVYQFQSPGGVPSYPATLYHVRRQLIGE